MKTPSTQRQRGLGSVAVILIIVALAALASALVRLSTVNHRASSNDILAARALQAAHAGKEWGLYQALHPGGAWNTCAGASQTLDLTADFGVRVTVNCDSVLYNEGLQDDGITPRLVRVFTIDAVACNGNGNCPDNVRALQLYYVERRLRAQATDK